jgi:hypothetical protein
MLNNENKVPGRFSKFILIHSLKLFKRIKSKRDITSIPLDCKNSFTRLFPKIIPPVANIKCLMAIPSRKVKRNIRISIMAIMKTGWFAVPRKARRNIKMPEWMKRYGMVSATVNPSGVPSHESSTVVNGLVIKSEQKINDGREPQRRNASHANNEYAPTIIANVNALKVIVPVNPRKYAIKGRTSVSCQ